MSHAICTCMDEKPRFAHRSDAIYFLSCGYFRNGEYIAFTCIYKVGAGIMRRGVL